MIQKLFAFIMRIRQEEDSVRRSWAIGSTIVSMIFVISVWTVYINFSVQDAVPNENKVDQPSFVQTFGRGLGIVAEETGKKLNLAVARIKSLFKETRSVNVRTASFNFVLEGLDPIQPQALTY